MKIITFLIITLSISLNSFAQEKSEEKNDHHCLLEENSLTVGIGLPYSIEVNSVGANIRMYHNIGEHICFGPEFSYFKKDDTEVIDFDFVGHYIFETELVGIYPLFGGNYTVEKETEFQTEEIEESFGVVFGGGIHRSFKNITVFAEYSRVELGIDDQFITTGIMYTFK